MRAADSPTCRGRRSRWPTGAGPLPAATSGWRTPSRHSPRRSASATTTSRPTCTPPRTGTSWRSTTAGSTGSPTAREHRRAAVCRGARGADRRPRAHPPPRRAPRGVPHHAGQHRRQVRRGSGSDDRRDPPARGARPGVRRLVLGTAGPGRPARPRAPPRHGRGRGRHRRDAVRPRPGEPLPPYAGTGAPDPGRVPPRRAPGHPRHPGAGPLRPPPRQAAARVVPRVEPGGRRGDAPAARPRGRRHRHRPHPRPRRGARRPRHPPAGVAEPAPTTASRRRTRYRDGRGSRARDSGAGPAVPRVCRRDRVDARPA